MHVKLLAKQQAHTYVSYQQAEDAGMPAFALGDMQNFHVHFYSSRYSVY